MSESTGPVVGGRATTQVEEASQPPQQQDNIRIVPLEMEHLDDVCRVYKESFRSKRFLFCFPLTESYSEMRRRYSKYPASKLELGAVAMKQDDDDDDGANTTILGHVQMAVKGHPVYPMELHSCHTGEMYIETIAVSADARGIGLGTELLQWCEAKARSTEGINRLTLEVLRGNRAIGLYERFGFREIPKMDPCDEACDCFCTCFVMGRPYGCCNRGWGSIVMEKRLT